MPVRTFPTSRRVSRAIFLARRNGGPRHRVFSIAGLGRLFGDTNQIVSEISRRGEEMRIVANLAIAATLAARHLRGVTTIARGQEPKILGALPVAALPADPALLVTLERWGSPH